jgi:predicted phage-related endonuclease
MLDQEIRKLGIGGSEIGALFGVDEDRNAFSVWNAKKGGMSGAFTPTSRMIVGKALERGVLELYTHVTGRAVEYCDVTSRHPERPWQVYTPDALCTDERRGVDAKVVFWDQRWKWGETAEEIPERIQLQALWYLNAMDFDAWDICALVGEDMPRVYTIHRDPEVERVMLARAEEFYTRFLVGDERPAFGNSPDAARWLQRAYPRHKPESIRFATKKESELLDEYSDVRVAEKEIAKLRIEYETRIKATIGDLEGLRWAHGKFTWRRTKDSLATDWAALAARLLNDYVPDTETRKKLVAGFTEKTDGVRRIDWRFTGPRVERVEDSTEVA